MTRLQIRNMIRKRLGETTASFWSDSELNTWINDACRDIAFRTKCIRTNLYMNAVDETAEYGLSTIFPNVLSINEYYYKQDGTNYIKLPQTSRTELDATYSGWRSAQSGTPIMYYYDREEDIFGLYPAPNLAITEGTNWGRAYITKNHTDMTLDTDIPQLPEYVQAAVADYVTAYGYEQRGWGDKANDAWTKYYSKLKDYQVERHREKEDEDLVMKNYRNL